MRYRVLAPAVPVPVQKFPIIRAQLVAPDTTELFLDFTPYFASAGVASVRGRLVLLNDDCDGTSNGCGYQGEYQVGDIAQAVVSETWYDTVWGNSHKFGSAAAALGDADGDGFEDFAIGASAYVAAEDVYGARRGAIYVFRGAVPLQETAAGAWTRVYGADQLSFLNLVPDALGDVDGDGLAELLAVANREEDSDDAVYYVLSPSGWQVLTHRQIDPDNPPYQDWGDIRRLVIAPDDNFLTLAGSPSEVLLAGTSTDIVAARPHTLLFGDHLVTCWDQRDMGTTNTNVHIRVETYR